MYIAIIGNVGAGKSTLLNSLRQELDHNSFHFLDEPEEEWRKITDEKGINPLEYFYKEPKKYAFNLQVLAFITRLNTIQKAQREHPNKHHLSERCLEEDRHVFARKLNAGGMITNIEYKTYLAWYETQAIKPDLLFYIETPVDICLERIRMRDRPEELSIGKNYIESLERYYTQFVLTNNIRLIKLDGRKSVERLTEDIICFMGINNIILS